MVSEKSIGTHMFMIQYIKQRISILEFVKFKLLLIGMLYIEQLQKFQPLSLRNHGPQDEPKQKHPLIYPQLPSINYFINHTGRMMSGLRTCLKVEWTKVSSRSSISVFRPLWISSYYPKIEGNTNHSWLLLQELI
jgi:hypothetical protein